MSASAPSVVVCPRDGAELVEIEHNGVMTGACPPTYRGIWLDRRRGRFLDSFLDLGGD